MCCSRSHEGLHKCPALHPTTIEHPPRPKQATVANQQFYKHLIRAHDAAFTTSAEMATKPTLFSYDRDRAQANWRTLSSKSITKAQVDLQLLPHPHLPPRPPSRAATMPSSLLSLALSASSLACRALVQPSSANIGPSSAPAHTSAVPLSISHGSVMSCAGRWPQWWGSPKRTRSATCSRPSRRPAARLSRWRESRPRESRPRDSRPRESRHLTSQMQRDNPQTALPLTGGCASPLSPASAGVGRGSANGGVDIRLFSVDVPASAEYGTL